MIQPSKNGGCFTNSKWRFFEQKYGEFICDKNWEPITMIHKTKTGWWFEPLWKIWKSIGMSIPNIWENKKCSKPPTRKKWWLATGCSISTIICWSVVFTLIVIGWVVCTVVGECVMRHHPTLLGMKASNHQLKHVLPKSILGFHLPVVRRKSQSISSLFTSIPVVGYTSYKSNVQERSRKQVMQPPITVNQPSLINHIGHIPLCSKAADIRC